MSAMELGPEERMSLLTGCCAYCGYCYTAVPPLQVWKLDYCSLRCWFKALMEPLEQEEPPATDAQDAAP